MSAGKLLPRHHEQFRSKEYWNDFFRQRTEAFEWYGEYADLRKLVHKTLRREDRILVIGCGNSNFSADLYDDGFEEVENVDFSEPVVAEMCRLHAKPRPRMTWRVMDVTNMSGYEEGAFDAVIDKGTLDALMSEDTPEIRKTGSAMLREVARVVRPGGRYICVTLWQDFIGYTLLSAIAWQYAEFRTRWTLDLYSAAAGSKPSPYLPIYVVASKSPSESHAPRDRVDGAPSGIGADEDEDEDKGVADFAGGIRADAWCDTAGKPLPPGRQPISLVGERQILDHIREGQKLHRRRHDLRDIRPGRFEQEDLWGNEGGAEGQKSPRFTLLIRDVESSSSPSVSSCAVVLIPRGRERDFTFSSPEGLRQVAESANTRRLIGVRLNRGHTFDGGVEGVKAEISPFIPDFAPASAGTDPGGLGIPIMAVSDQLGSEAMVLAEGCLEYSGNYVVEEEEEDEDEDDEDVGGRPAGVYRRLIFLENEGIVQTEVRLLGEDEEDGHKGAPRSGSMGGNKSSGGGKSKSVGKKGGKKGKKSGKGKKSSSSSAKGGGVGAEESLGLDEPGADGDGAALVRVDSSFLCFELHRCMAAGMALADLRPTSDARAPTALVIGLGGGALPMALRRIYPGVRVLAVELDPGIVDVAKNHFGLEESDKLKVVVDDGIAFVNSLIPKRTANEAVQDDLVARPSLPGDESTEPSPGSTRNGLSEAVVPQELVAPSSSCPPKVSYTTGARDPCDAVSPLPSCDELAEDRATGALRNTSTKAAEVGWDESFGPPFSAIFVDVDSKDKSVGMSCPPAAFLDTAFLANLRALLRGTSTSRREGGSSLSAGEGHGHGQGPGVLAINIAARSRELFDKAVDAVTRTFAGGELHRLRAGQDAVNSVLLGLPRPRPRARSGPLVAVIEQSLESAPISRRAKGSILAVCDRSEKLPVAEDNSKSSRGGSSGGGKQGSKGKNKKRGTR